MNMDGLCTSAMNRDGFYNSAMNRDGLCTSAMNRGGLCTSAMYRDDLLCSTLLTADWFWYAGTDTGIEVGMDTFLLVHWSLNGWTENGQRTDRGWTEDGQRMRGRRTFPKMATRPVGR